MKKSYYSLGLMSGTSMDGVDASIIQSDGYTRYNVISDKYFKYDRVIFRELSTLRNKIKTSHDLRKFSEKLNVLEKKITIFHAKVVKKILNKSKVNVNFIGFHGQTIFHSAKKKITRQLGDGKLLSKLTKKIVIYNFRKNDLKNGGQGAPLTPIFHKLLANKIGINEPTIFINLGGIANITFITKHKIFSSDIGPANCLIDQWVKTRSKKKCDLNGSLS